MKKPTGNYQVYYNNEAGQQVPYLHTTLGPLTFYHACFAEDLIKSLMRDQDKAVDDGYMAESDMEFWFVRHCPNLPIGFTFKAAGYRYQMASDPKFIVTYAYLGGSDMNIWKYHIGLVISDASGDILPEYQKDYGSRKDLIHSLGDRTYVDFFTDTEEEIRKVMLK